MWNSIFPLKILNFVNNQNKNGNFFIYVLTTLHNGSLISLFYQNEGITILLCVCKKRGGVLEPFIFCHIIRLVSTKIKYRKKEKEIQRKDLKGMERERILFLQKENRMEI